MAEYRRAEWNDKGYGMIKDMESFVISFSFDRLLNIPRLWIL